MRQNFWQSKIRYVCKLDIWQESLLIIIYFIFKDRFPITLAVSFVFLSFHKHKKCFIVLIFIILFNMPANIRAPQTKKGMIIDIKANYYILQLIDQKVLLYTDEALIYDQYIEIEGNYEEITSNRSSYGFDFKKYNNRQGIYYQIDAAEVSILKNNLSLRSIIYAANESSYVHKFIFNVNSDDDIISSFINSGYCFSSFIYLFLSICRLFITPKKVSKLEIGLLLIFGFFYHFNFITCRLLLNVIFRRINATNKQKAGWLGLFCVVFFPHNVFSLKFLLPFGINIIYGLRYEKGWVIFYNIFLQSILFSRINVFLLFGYKWFSKILGLCFFLSIIDYVVDMSMIINFINKGISVLELLVINQSGKSLVFLFIYLILQMLRIKKAEFYTITILLLMIKGWLFPFASVSYINIGQGDAILIKDHFNKANYLIDTGKESQFSALDTYLKAKGVKTIDILFITHYDNDHCGNIKKLKEKYKIDSIVDYHFSQINHNFTFYELNDHFIEKNENSLVIYTMINGRSLLFMGDAAMSNEINILENYPALEADYLKLGHHGSKTSTSLRFLHQIKPKLALISSGNFAYYQHPHPQVITLLDQLHIPYLITNDDGDIEIYFTMLGEFIITSNRKISFVFNPNIFNHDIIRTR